MDTVYFKRCLRPYEAEAYLDGLENRGRAAWEQTRMTAYCILAPYSKDLKVGDVMKFSWDAEAPEATREQIEDVRQWAVSLPQINKSDG